MNSAKHCESDSNLTLDAIRKKIDEIDSGILELLNQRAALSVEVGILKANAGDRIFKPLREKELLEKLSEKNGEFLPDAHMRAIWREILGSSRQLQEPQRVAYLGPEGTFSYFAARDYLGSSTDFQPCRDIPEIFEKITNNSCHLGIVPLENSLQGIIGVSVDMFLKYDVAIVAELYSRISHSLLSREKKLADIKRVFSHPQPLGQCGDWLRTNLPYAELVSVSSTAQAAQLAADSPGSAALGNINLSTLYGLPVLASQIEDHKNNWTRFVAIGRRDENKLDSEREMADKSSALFTIPDKPGTLAKVLALIGENGLNMRKIESRPMIGQPWHYVFFVDIENNLQNPVHTAALAEIAHSCLSFRLLGSYSQGPRFDYTPEINNDDKGK